ncbi:MAG: hypothetical protein CMJ67_05050 [Planctomycetaceae bacterium]|nr:hypothetical protein [Planctomycetaceae bacterium]
MADRSEQGRRRADRPGRFGFWGQPSTLGGMHERSVHRILLLPTARRRLDDHQRSCGNPIGNGDDQSPRWNQWPPGHRDDHSNDHGTPRPQRVVAGSNRTAAANHRRSQAANPMSLPQEPRPCSASWWRRLTRILARSQRGPPPPPPDPLDPHELGRHGEEIAARMLARSGLRIISRNQRVAGVEVDVIAESPDEDLLLIIEVKTSRGNTPPEHRVDRSRRQRLARAASSLARNRAVAIEVVAVSINDGKSAVRRIRLEPSDIPAPVLRGGGSTFNGR